MKTNRKAKILVIVFSVLCALAGAAIGIFCKNELAAFALIVIKNKRFYKIFLLWLFDALVLGATFFVLFISIDYALLIALMCYWLLILTVLVECNRRLKEDEAKSYSFATVIIYLIVALDVFGTFFGGTFYMVYSFGGAPGDAAFAVYKYLLSLGSTILILVILFRVLNILAMLKQNMYDPEAVGVLNGIVKLSKATILYCVIANSERRY